ncbi:hypothetical protein ETI03_11255 [Macrococcoides canis]|uniref:rolling circle replication-associated protein n=1 Tax=Macrococcoides canis TaxID=1855823 RepID=UPI00105D081C|nr:hypothetical protein [Macrococcus canis]TDM28964.1 hypothetical protein ETI03_11255 [Macrococcus canis]
MAETGVIKSKIKEYPDGTKKITVYENARVVYYGNSDKNKETNLKMNEEDLEKSRIQRVYESRTKIKDYVLSNDFTHFWTLTQDEKIVGDRFADDIALKNLYRFLNKSRTYAKRKGIEFGYLFIAERHKNGALHFHGFTFGFPYELVDSTKKWKGNIIFNCKQWIYGFSNITELRDKRRASNYISKYLVKELFNQNLGKSKKRYWSSKNLKKPEVRYTELELCKKEKADWVSDDGTIKIYYVKGEIESGKSKR